MIHDLILTVRRVSCMVNDVFVLLTSRPVYFGTHFSIRTIMVITWFIITLEIHSSTRGGGLVRVLITITRHASGT
jgi:hypothetical protein